MVYNSPVHELFAPVERSLDITGMQQFKLGLFTPSKVERTIEYCETRDELYVTFRRKKSEDYAAYYGLRVVSSSEADMSVVSLTLLPWGNWFEAKAMVPTYKVADVVHELLAELQHVESDAPAHVAKVVFSTFASLL